MEELITFKEIKEIDDNLLLKSELKEVKIDK